MEFPQLRFTLPHLAAVKGILYCPWAPSLLVTGGGSNDQHLRFWHTKSGALISQSKLNGQITSVTWSNSRKELAVSFGLLSAPMLLNVYSYPDMQLLKTARIYGSMRALSASVLPDQTRIALAANDCTVRVYGLWDPRAHEITGLPDFQGAGMFGSRVIENSEGIGEGPRWR